ncbi:MAG: YozE family protein [Chloroflexota bacterium]
MPDDAKSQTSEVNAAMEYFSFYQWLKTQIERNDIIGDFAHTISQFDEPQTNRKKANGHMIWATWLVDKNASPAVIEAFNTAWHEYQNQVRPS